MRLTTQETVSPGGVNEPRTASSAQQARARGHVGGCAPRCMHIAFFATCAFRNSPTRGRMVISGESVSEKSGFSLSCKKFCFEDAEIVIVYFSDDIFFKNLLPNVLPLLRNVFDGRVLFFLHSSESLTFATSHILKCSTLRAYPTF